MSRSTSSAALAMIATLTACGGDDAGTSGARWQATVDTVADTITVRTTGGSVWGYPATLAERASIGTIEGDDAYMLGRVGSIAVTSRGDVLVLDTQVPVIRKYDANGTHLVDIGRSGGGPGEFKSPEAMNVLPDGRIVVRDPGNARITVLNPDGTWNDDWRLPYGGSWGTSEKLYVDTAGNTYIYILLDIQADIEDWAYGLGRYTPEGVLADTIPYPTWDYEEQAVVARNEHSSSRRRVPFTPEVIATFSPLGYMVGGVSTDYRIDLLRHGEPVVQIERARQPVPVSDAEKDERVDQIEQNLRRNYPGWRWNGPAVPDTKPPFTGILVDDNGRIWVQLSQPGVEFRTEEEAREEARRTERPQLRYREPVIFDVFETDGRYLGAVHMPDGFRTFPAPVIHGDVMWAVVFDELDVPRVIRYAIQHAVE